MDQDTGTALRIAIAAVPGKAMIARDLLVQALGISRDAAENVLARGHGDVRAARLPRHRSLTLLRLLGVDAQVMDAATTGGVDLSLRYRKGADPAKVAGWLERVCPQIAKAALGGTSGLVLSHLQPQEAADLHRRLADCDGLSVALSPRQSALYDVFAPGGFGVPAELQAYLRILGCDETQRDQALGGALATGLDPVTTARLMARFGHLGLEPVNQAFQRFDLLVTGPGCLSQVEMQDFLATRGCFGDRAQGAVVVETGLSRRDARQFLNDYRHIGLQVDLRLMRG